MPGDRSFSLAAIRINARKAATATSLRAVAADIGMSYTGFRAFLAGGKPHPRTRRLLILWYAERRRPDAIQRRRVSRTDAEIAAAALGMHIRRDGREAARDALLLEFVTEITREAGSSAELRERLAALRAEWRGSGAT